MDTDEKATRLVTCKRCEQLYPLSLLCPCRHCRALICPGCAKRVSVYVFCLDCFSRQFPTAPDSGQMAVAKVMLFANREVMVYDKWGQQVTELQGTFDDVKERIRAVYSGTWSFCLFGVFDSGPLAYHDIEQLVYQLKTCWHDEQEPPQPV